jgi:hypothetical protein
MTVQVPKSWASHHFAAWTSTPAASSVDVMPFACDFLFTLREPGRFASKRLVAAQDKSGQPSLARRVRATVESEPDTPWRVTPTPHPIAFVEKGTPS